MVNRALLPNVTSQTVVDGLLLKRVVDALAQDASSDEDLSFDRSGLTNGTKTLLGSLNTITMVAPSLGYFTVQAPLPENVGQVFGVKSISINGIASSGSFGVSATRNRDGVQYLLEAPGTNNTGNGLFVSSCVISGSGTCVKWAFSGNEWVMI